MLISACGKDQSTAAGIPTAKASTSVKSSKPKIVFHDTIDDPQCEYLNELGGGVSKASGTSDFDLVLYETEPNVFEGCGILRLSVKILQDEAGGSAQEYVYRTGLIRAEVGKEGSVTGCLSYNSDMEPMISEAPFDVTINKHATQRHENLPLLLTLNGNKAA